MIQIDIDMPKNCVECPIHDGEYGRCNVNKDISVNFEERPRKCPLIESEQEEYEKGYEKGYNDGFEIGQYDVHPEIIQCKNCKHMGHYAFPPKYDIRPYCNERERTIEEDDFCSWAERRTDETD